MTGRQEAAAFLLRSHARATLLSREALIQTLAFKLCHGKGVSRAALLKAYSEEQTRMIAAELVEHMELSGFTIAKKPPAPAHSTAPHLPDHRRRPDPA